MKKIAYVIPYFGKLPSNFELWLLSCRVNSTIDWIIITDDRTVYEYPENVKVIYDSYENMKSRIQNNFDFEVYVDAPWRLSFFKPAYGEIFRSELANYDFWGYCDIDLVWGNIRHFITDEILNKYERIGYQGHSTLYRNSSKVNSRYKTITDEMYNYKIVFSTDVRYSFDENGMDAIYNYLGIEYYKEGIFAHLRKYTKNFSLEHLPVNEEYKNNCQIFIWSREGLKRVYLKNEELFYEEFLYLHFFCRPISYDMKILNIEAKYVIYPDRVIDMNKDITPEYVRKKGNNSAAIFLIKAMWINRKKINLKKIIINFRNIIAQRERMKKKSRISNTNNY